MDRATVRISKTNRGYCALGLSEERGRGYDDIEQLTHRCVEFQPASTEYHQLFFPCPVGDAGRRMRFRGVGRIFFSPKALLFTARGKNGHTAAHDARCHANRVTSQDPGFSPSFNEICCAPCTVLCLRLALQVLLASASLVSAPQLIKIPMRQTGLTV